jgi:hypothetical protein
MMKLRLEATQETCNRSNIFFFQYHFLLFQEWERRNDQFLVNRRKLEKTIFPKWEKVENKIFPMGGRG